MDRVKLLLSPFRSDTGVTGCRALSSLVHGFGLTFLPLRQLTVEWRIPLFARRRPAVESFPSFTLDFTPHWAATGLESRRPPEPHKRAQGISNAKGVCLPNRRCLPD